jgi:hypothetical protein
LLLKIDEVICFFQIGILKNVTRNPILRLTKFQALKKIMRLQSNHGAILQKKRGEITKITGVPLDQEKKIQL